MAASASEASSLSSPSPSIAPFQRSWISQPSQGLYPAPFPDSAYQVNFQNIFDTVFLRHLSVEYIENWRWHEGKTWLSDTWTVLLVCIVYVAIVHGLHFIIKRTKPFDLNWFVIIHNALLSISSGVLFIALFAELWRMSSQHGLWLVFCDPDNGREVQFNYGRIYFIYYLNYLFKYWELLDTFLLALRGKPTPFLHVYHHAATLYLCWSQLGAESCVQWVVIVINLFVHVIMYAYYTLHALKIDVWWKKIVTQIQIIQFVIALSACWFGFASRLLHDYAGMKGVDHCSGSYPGAIVGIVILSSYLILFIQFFIDTYRARKNRKAAAAKAALDVAANGNGHSNGHSKSD